MIEKITIDKTLFDDLVKAMLEYKDETSNYITFKILCEIEETAERAENEHYKRMREEKTR